MEVHTHIDPAHGGTSRKKWKHYFWEFFMLFLAITLGFFVENQREHIVENRREKVFIHSAVEDLQQDINQLDSIILKRKEMDQWMDSLLFCMNSPDIKKYGNEIYYYSRWVPRTYRFYSTDRTITQLKYGGNWRLIHNQKVSDGLATYDQIAKTLAIYIEQREESLVLIWYQSVNKLFDNKIFEGMITGVSFRRPTENPPLLSYDKALINEFCNQTHFRKNSNLYFITTAEKLLFEAKKTLVLIQKEYHLE